jgi:hypothetical protein
MAIGCNFPAASAIKFNGTLHQALFVDASHISIGLTAADVAAAGVVAITLSSAGADYGSGMLSIVPPAVYWNFFGTGPRPLSPDVQLLLMVLTIGAFASSVYALKSLSDYRGDNRLFTSWITLYIIQPFEGAGSALLLYLVVRGGFLAGGGGDLKGVNQFGVCAIAGLAGAFSDVAFLKLREVFMTLFKPQDDRGGKPGALQITSTSLPDGTAGASYAQQLQATGGITPLKWSVSPALPSPLTLDSAAGAINGTPTGPSPKATYRFTVTDSASPAASATADLTLEIQAAAPGLTITTALLPDAKTGSAYTQILQPSGGVAPLTWSVSPALPSPLTLDPAAGTINGTPTVPSPKATYRFTVTDSASPAASATADLTLQIQ